GAVLQTRKRIIDRQFQCLEKTEPVFPGIGSFQRLFFVTAREGGEDCNVLKAQHILAHGNAMGLGKDTWICPEGTIQNLPADCVAPSGQMDRGSGNLGLRPRLNCVVLSAHGIPE
ncbi:hypothetical protein P4B35_23310, partial [Pontiellaceae bacterium B12227]|nr:hypothetical protein [Pontiellaceae bacterium B12227]